MPFHTHLWNICIKSVCLPDSQTGIGIPAFAVCKSLWIHHFINHLPADSAPHLFAFSSDYIYQENR